MRPFLLAAVLVLAAAATPAAAKPLHCRVFHFYGAAKSAEARGVSPREFCERHGGWSCGNPTKMSQAVCFALKGQNCMYADIMGVGLCLGFGGQNCLYLDENDGQGICSASQGQNCKHVRGLAQGLCYAMGEFGCNNVNETPDEVRTWLGRIRKSCE